MTLHEVLELTQEDHVRHWVLIPEFGQVSLEPSSTLENFGSTEHPALVPVRYRYRAVYAPEPSLSLGWGLDERELLDGRRDRPATLTGTSYRATTRTAALRRSTICSRRATARRLTFCSTAP